MRKRQKTVKKLILVVAGGIGNQLFMYAAARRVAKINDSRLLLDTTSGFVEDSYQQIYQLDRFSIKAEEAPDELTFNRRWNRFQRSFLKKLNRLLPYQKRWFITEKSGPDRLTSFDGRLLDLVLYHDNTYMMDYFQCERYFSDMRRDLMQEFIVRVPFNDRTKKVAADIIATPNPVAVHARQLRGAPNTDGAAPPSGIEQKPFAYYEKALGYVEKNLADPHFFCFGDDPVWLKENWHSAYPATFVDHNNGREEAVQDFYLMGLCQHFIIGNSSFSWWPAWLSGNPNKIVVAPRNEEPHIWSGNREVIPDDWITF